MRCPECDYPLWNLKGRNCPECGFAFVPSDFDFVINSVQFCCPHCDQPYYGTGERGHLVPAAFNCVRCNTYVHMNDMVLRSAEGVAESQTKVDSMPWLERKTRGTIKAWFATIGMAMGAPNRLMRALPESSSVSEAWRFMLWTVVVFAAVGIAIPVGIIGAIAVINGDPSGGATLGTALGILVGESVLMLIMVALWGLVIQGMLRVTGGCEATIGRTYAALCYSSGTLAPLAVPCLGHYCGSSMVWIWWVISAILMIAEGQRVHGGRATLAVLTWPVLVIGTVVLAYMALVFSLFSGMSGVGGGPFAGAWNAAGNSEAQVVAMAVTNYASDHDGVGPTHGLELVTSDYLTGNEFVSMSTLTIVSDIPAGDRTLDEMEFMPPNRRRMHVQALADAMPDAVVAHRVGDFVFTHHGINFDTGSPMLWVVVLIPDPAVNTGGIGNTPVFIGSLGNPPQYVPLSALPMLLQIQNDLRATEGLPPLPDPTTVLHDQPAVASEGDW